jgi:hypothetical protein
MGFCETAGPMPVDRECCELLRAIVRQPPNATAQRIDRLAGNIRDWDSLLKLAREHRVLPMLFLRLADLGPAVPPAAKNHLQTEYDRNVVQNLANVAELIGLFEAFDQEGIPAMPFKGVVLGASIYGDLTTRPAGDVVVLIHHRHLARATAILLEWGCELKTPVRTDGTPVDPNYYEYHFERQRDGMTIELRWRLELTHLRFRRNLGMDWVWPRRRIATLAGAEVPDLDPEIKLLVLCMHGSKHAWSRLIWICDVGQLLASSPGLDWREVTEEAKRVGLWRTLVLGVLLAHRVAGATVPQAVLRRFESDATACSLARHIQENLFDAPGSAPMGRMPYNMHLLGFHDRVRLLLSLDVLRPNERDRAAIHLPPSLDFLYYLVRPVRILWDRSARL